MINKLKADIESIIEQYCNQSSREAHYHAAAKIAELIASQSLVNTQGESEWNKIEQLTKKEEGK